MRGGRIIRKEEGWTMRYEEARKKLRVFQQLTGMTIDEFDQMKASFEKAYEADEQERGKPDRRARAEGSVVDMHRQAVLHLVLLAALPNAGSVGVLVRHQPGPSE